MRIALLLSSLAFAACTVGEVATTNSNGGGGGGPDAGGGSNMGSGADLSVCVDRLASPDDAHKHTAGGTSNKGLNCVVAGCHDPKSPGTGAPPYQFAGTVFASGGAPSPGAVVRIVTPAKVLQTYADADGNFHFDPGSLQGPFTATTGVAGCPTATKMVTTLSDTAGPTGNSCNSCHVSGGSAGGPITL